MHQAIEDSLTAKERGATVEQLLSKCQKVVADTYTKNDQLMKADDPDKFQKELEKWLDAFAAKNDHYMDKARQYIDECRRCRSP